MTIIAITIFILICSLIISVFPRIDSYRDRRFKGLWKQIKPQGRFLLGVSFVLLILQIIFFEITRRESRNNSDTIASLEMSGEKLNQSLEISNELIDSLKEQMQKLNQNTDEFSNELKNKNKISVKGINRSQANFIFHENRIGWKVDNDEEGIQICIENRGDAPGAIKKITKYLIIEDSLGIIKKHITFNQTIPVDTKIFKTAIEDNVMCIFHSVNFHREHFTAEKINMYLYMNLNYFDPITSKIKILEEIFICRHNLPVEEWYLSNEKEKNQIMSYLKQNRLI